MSENEKNQNLGTPEEKKEELVEEITDFAESEGESDANAVMTPPDPKTVTAPNLLKFLILSGIGVFCFFIPVGSSGSVPMVLIINAIKAWLDSVVVSGTSMRRWLVFIVCLALSITYAVSRFNKKGVLAEFHKKDGWGTAILYYLSLVFSIMMVFHVGPDWLLNDNTGYEAIDLAGSCLLTVTIAGWLVTFLIEFGILEFIGTLMMPIMRRCFKLPGYAAVDAVSSFVAAPAVGVFMTNRLYNENVYTLKEASCVATNFSVCSLGFFALLVSITDTPYMYGAAVVTSLIISFILAAIVIRIPPLAKKPDTYANGKTQPPEARKPAHYNAKTFPTAIAAATTKVQDKNLSVLITAIPGVLSFALKIVTFVEGLATLSLAISEYTPFFQWIGKPVIPYLQLVQIPDAAAVAPSCLVGIAEIALPCMLIAGQALQPVSIFFVIVLSTVQIIFFTESANAMMQSDMNLKLPELVLIFIIRTVIAIPIVALFANLLY